MTTLTPLIISGAPRSGTSLVYNLFDGHTDISWLLNEGFLFENLYPFGSENVDIFLDLANSDTDKFVAGLRGKQLIPPLETPYVQSQELGSMSEFRLISPWDEAAFREVLAKNAGTFDSIETLWRILAKACLTGMGQPLKRYGCLKAPDYAKSAAAAVTTIPSARAIVVLRDPLHALDSLKRSRDMRSEKQLSWPVFANCVLEMRLMLDRIAKADPKRLMWLRYEDLVQEPEFTMRKVATWADISYESCLVEPTMLGQTWPGLSSFKATSGIEKTPAQRKISALSDQEQAAIRRALSGYKQYGYDL